MFNQNWGLAIICAYSDFLNDDNDDQFFMLLGRSFHKFEPETVKLRWLQAVLVLNIRYECALEKTGMQERRKNVCEVFS